MAPRVTAASRCTVSKVQDFEDTPEADFDEIAVLSGDDEIKYGFLQIRGYRSQTTRRKDSNSEPLERQWVTLPRDTYVQTYDDSEVVEVVPKKTRDTSLLRSCLRQAHGIACKDMDEDIEIASTTSCSTTASSSDCRRVHFRDGCMPGWDDEDIQADLADEADLPVADWHYVDRDICGYSLHIYAPDADNKDFASSKYAASFSRELEALEFRVMYKHQEMTLNEDDQTAYKQEERRLDKALLLAGVHVNCIHAAPEDLSETEVCI
jgi:hypothetical protein